MHNPQPLAPVEHILNISTNATLASNDKMINKYGMI